MISFSVRIRSKNGGGELRLGTFSIYMTTILANSDWDPQKPGIILLIVHKLVQKREGNKA
ncbi:unknown protein [Microcystis aeruginosa NIES-843]|uniref:Uncharacterized protein n=1 Tax=Microcystis aeruginosa (strain NIES-843 / IAM M-2473) TaxID=449447 RepID=B0JYB1_MICAN|nr:unknown protein [Microcystis aeruginosa NIES-843]